MTNYVVTAAATYVTIPGAGAVLLYQGAPVPDSAEGLDALVSDGFIAEVKSVDLIGGQQNDVPDRPVVPEDNDVPEADDVDGDGPIPAKSASKADWVAYAVSQGATEDEANASTKEDLIAAYGSTK